MGAGRKVWAANDVLAAADMNSYLMDQSVMVFADSDARYAAIPEPDTGMITYRTDGTVVEVYNGSSWVGTNTVGGTLAGSKLTGIITTATINNANVTNTLTASTATAYTIASTDQGDILRFTAAGTVTATVSTATSFTAGQRVDIVADGAAGVKIAAGAGVTFGGAGTSGTAYTFGQYDAVSVLCVDTNNYRIIGNVSVA